eukprot:TRINITY_DN9278_c0_g1_i1.p1 TRINITY_DN9278_c0_g1~~TRINITY_DN9278_c0_g1_i1.p1  ORF type:complete len:107 (+),score=22.93 TRINITY_DN9278_c0_g1_i1:92-412(+)
MCIRDRVSTQSTGRNTLAEFPDTKFREEISFMILRSSFLLADNSIEEKKIERFEQTLRECDDFIERHPRSSDVKNAEIIKEDSKRCLLYTSPSPRDRTRSRMPSSA